MIRELNLNNSIEMLLESSKKLQDRTRQELIRHSSINVECAKKKKLPPVGNNKLLVPYVRNIVAKHLLQGKSVIIKSNKHLKTPSKEIEEKTTRKKDGRKVAPTKNIGIQMDDFLLCTRKADSGGVQVERTTKKVILNSKGKTSLRSVSKANSLTANKSYMQSNKGLNKLSANSSYRLPLQRFAESSKTIIDFSTEHPELKLDMLSEPTTLFPKRIQRQPESLASNTESVNVVNAEVKPVELFASITQNESWNGILLQNQTKSKSPNEIVRLKRTKRLDVVGGTSKEQNLAEPESQKSHDIINSADANCLFILQKQSDRLAKQSNCNFQSFPVMYIQPEFQIRKVANISIRSGNLNNFSATKENISENVKYVECQYEDKGKTISLENNPESPGKDVTLKDATSQTNEEKNKFFNAFKFENLYNCSTMSDDCSSYIKQFSSSNKSQYSSSSSSSLKDMNPLKTDNNILTILNDKIPPLELHTTSLLTKHLVKSPPSRREVHVQTEYKTTKTVATSSSPIPCIKHCPQIPEAISTIPQTLKILPQSTNAAGQKPSKPEIPGEDDIIVKIFERIRNIVPNAHQLFMNNNTTTTIDSSTSAFPPITLVAEKQEKEAQKHGYEMSRISDTSKVQLRLNMKLPATKDRGGNDNKTTSKIEQIQKSHPTSISNDPFLVQSINRVKSSVANNAISYDRIVKQDRHECPTNAEINCAVKIFLDSLTNDVHNGKKKTKINGISTKSSKLNRRFISSDTSIFSDNVIVSSCNIRVRDAQISSIIPRWCDISDSSTPTELSSSDLESENDEVIKDLCCLSLNKNDSSSRSDGEVLSIGEV